MSEIHVSILKGADGLDGRVVALRFRYDPSLVSLVRQTLSRVSARDAPSRGGWSATDRCWWVGSDWWALVRRLLLDQGVKLYGPAAHPLSRRFGLADHEQTWDAAKCEWRWISPWARKGPRRRQR
jgi:hypothetical protein